MWTYRQSTGELSHDGRVVAFGYSGIGVGLFNPKAEAMANVGPIPAGLWHIGAPLDPPDHLGPWAMPLTPVGHDADGRSAFFIHGDGLAMNHTASHGCIILSRVNRQAIATSPDRDLTVVA